VPDRFGLAEDEQPLTGQVGNQAALHLGNGRKVESRIGIAALQVRPGASGADMGLVFGVPT
jgi:hypothetical protein